MIMHTRDREQAPASKSAGLAAGRKPYERPVLLQWGTLVDITRGPAADTQDDGFSGSGGV